MRVSAAECNLELAIKPGQIDVVRNLILEMVESTQNEPGALMYEWSISDDESTIHSYDRYADSDAVDRGVRGRESTRGRTG